MSKRIWKVAFGTARAQKYIKLDKAIVITMRHIAHMCALDRSQFAINANKVARNLPCNKPNWAMGEIDGRRFAVPWPGQLP